MSRRVLKIRLADFSYFREGLMPDFKGSLLERELSLHYDVRQVPAGNSADLMVYSDFGTEHRSFRGLKVHLSGENTLPDFNECDLAFGPHSDPGQPAAIRLPYYVLVTPNPERLLSINRGAPGARPGFCAFLASNPRAPERNRFFKALLRRAPVDSGGKVFNNIGGRVPDKSAWLRDYRFNLAFENSPGAGYITEKLVEPLLEGCIPVYWGAPDVTDEFDPRCFLDVRAFDSMDSAIEALLELDRDEGAQASMQRAPVFKGDRLPRYFDEGYIGGPIRDLLESGRPPGARRYSTKRLRSHVYGSSLRQSLVSLACRTEALAWRLGLGRVSPKRRHPLS